MLLRLCQIYRNNFLRKYRQIDKYYISFTSFNSFTGNVRYFAVDTVLFYRNCLCFFPFLDSSTSLSLAYSVFHFAFCFLFFGSLPWHSSHFVTQWTSDCSQKHIFCRWLIFFSCVHCKRRSLTTMSSLSVSYISFITFSCRLPWFFFSFRQSNNSVIQFLSDLFTNTITTGNLLSQVDNIMSYMVSIYKYSISIVYLSTHT